MDGLYLGERALTGHIFESIAVLIMFPEEVCSGSSNGRDGKNIVNLLTCLDLVLAIETLSCCGCSVI